MNHCEDCLMFLHVRYILKRRFDRGSYGEVWLACHWNCSQNGDALNQMSKSKTSPVSILCLDPHNLSVETNSSQHQCFNDTASDDLFILKRIMVRKICLLCASIITFFFYSKFQKWTSVILYCGVHILAL